MKKQTLLLMLCITVSYLAAAQQQVPERIRITPEKRAELRTLRMERDLQLTTEQKEKIQQANLEAETALQESLSMSEKEARRNKFEEINNKSGMPPAKRH